MKRAKIFDWWKLGIIFLASILRVYRFEELTEFLGDQGRTMLIMRDFFEHGVVPLIGPSTLSGHHLGPAFYYLLAPGYFLLGGEPLGVSLWIAILGVLAVIVLYETVKAMFGLWPARAVTLLWAVSPSIISSDRVIWEPNLVPLFSLLFIFLLFRAHRAWKSWMWSALGVTVGILIQLHYPTILFIGLLGLYFVGSIISKVHNFREVSKAGFWWVIGFVISILPFLWYEATVGFRDILGIASVMASGGGAPVGKRMMIYLWLEYAHRVFGRALPYMTRVTVGILLFVWGLFTLFRPTKINLFLSIWLLAGLTPMSRFSWVVFDHYLFFLTPVPFLMISSVLSAIKRYIWRPIAIVAIGAAIFFQLRSSDIFKPGNQDIQRISTVVRILRKEIGDTRFSFTLLNSKSFSDLHYRYYMKRAGLMPEDITDAYQRLVLICDAKKCISPKEIAKEREVQVLCYEEQCGGLYPKIALWDDWKIETYYEVSSPYDFGGMIYIFQRRLRPTL